MTDYVEAMARALEPFSKALEVAENVHNKCGLPIVVTDRFERQCRNYPLLDDFNEARIALAAYHASRQSGAARDVLAERRRQTEAEGWTPEHDDRHVKGELLDAALCYAQRRSDGRMFGEYYPTAPARWPWELTWWKPKTERSDLVRAAALIIAEIERLDRNSPSAPDEARQADQGRATLPAGEREDRR